MNGALVLRDARCEARRPRTYAVRVLYGVALAFVLGRVWTVVAPPGVVPTASDLAHAGRELYGGFLLTQFAVVSLLALVGGAETLARELRSGTMRLLVLTPVTESGIVASKWAAVMLQAVVLTLCGVPVLAACAYLGSAGVEDVAAGFVLTLANAGLAAACGLRGAASARTPAGAVLKGGLTYLGWAVVPAALAIPTAGVALLMGPFLHPLYAFGYLRAPNPSLGTLATATAAAAAAFLSARLLGRSATVLDRRVREVPDLLEPPPPPEKGRPWALTWWPGRWRRAGVWDDAPLLWKDLATRPAARLSGDGLLALGAAAFLVWYAALVVDQGRSRTGLALQLAVFTGLAVLAGAGLFTREKEGRRLEALLSGPLSPARIAGSRLGAVLLSPEAAIAGLMLALTLAVNSRGDAGQALRLASTVLPLLAVAYLVAAAASLRMPTLPSAVGLTAGVLAAAWHVLPAAWPQAGPWISPVASLASPELVGRYAAGQAVAAAVLAAWIAARLRPTVLGGTR